MRKILRCKKQGGIGLEVLAPVVTASWEPRFEAMSASACYRNPSTTSALLTLVVHCATVGDMQTDKQPLFTRPDGSRYGSVPTVRQRIKGIFLELDPRPYWQGNTATEKFKNLFSNGPGSLVGAIVVMGVPIWLGLWLADRFPGLPDLMGEVAGAATLLAIAVVLFQAWKTARKEAASPSRSSAPCAALPPPHPTHSGPQSFPRSPCESSGQH
jgi:hypothetical protein